MGGNKIDPRLIEELLEEQPEIIGSAVVAVRPYRFQTVFNKLVRSIALKLGVLIEPDVNVTMADVLALGMEVWTLFGIWILGFGI